MSDIRFRQKNLALELILGFVVVAICIYFKHFALACIAVYLCQKNIRELFRREEDGALLMDAEALLDSRVLELCNYVFEEKKIIIPQFVLDRIQKILAYDPQNKRAIATFEKLRELRKKRDVFIEETKFSSELEDVYRFIRLARRYSCIVVTLDSSLISSFKKARVRTFSVRTLTDSLIYSVFPGDQIEITIEKIGREPDQGVGFLEDGSIVIVQNARLDIGKRIETVVINVLNQKTGRVVFAQKK